MQLGLVEWLLQNNKKGYSVEGGNAQISLRSRVSKQSVNKTHVTSRLTNLFSKWQGKKDGVNLGQIDEKAGECVEYIWSNLEKPEVPTTYWLERRENKAAKRRREEFEEEEQLEAEGSVSTKKTKLNDDEDTVNDEEN